MIKRRDLLAAAMGAGAALVDGKMERVGAGSVIFNASNQLHSIRNVGEGPATYHVINWKSPATPQK